MSIYADGTYLTNNPNWHMEDSPAKARWIGEVLKRINEPLRTIAEVGCGAGEILLELHKEHPEAQFFGYEISEQAYSICSSKETAAVKFLFEDIMRSDKHFDVLLAIDIFEHVPDYMGFLKQLKNLATYKIFHIPLDLSVQGTLRGTSLMHTRKTVGHLHYFDKDTALATLTDCGYEVIHWNYTFGSEELPNKRLRTRALNVPRRLLRLVNKDFTVRLLGGASIMVLTR